MIQRSFDLWNLVRLMGPGWIAFRARSAARLRFGFAQRQLPLAKWEERPLGRYLADPQLAAPERYLEYRQSDSPAFFFRPEDRSSYRPLLARWEGKLSSPVQVSRRLRAGQLTLFGSTQVNLGFPPDWHHSPLTGDAWPSHLHWSQLGDFDRGDIKAVWEPSRFAFAFDLVRAYWRSGDEEHAELFWQIADDWYRNNPPQHGVNWKCGQEITFRVMAWCFALYGFLDSGRSTPSRVQRLAQMIAVSAERIEFNLDYALRQANNHGMSEALGLWTVGTLFPEFKESRHYRDLGLRHLRQQVGLLIDSDGAFSQHSMNYHRMLLHELVWFCQLGRLNQEPLEDFIIQRLRGRRIS